MIQRRKNFTTRYFTTRLNRIVAHVTFIAFILQAISPTTFAQQSSSREPFTEFTRAAKLNAARVEVDASQTSKFTIPATLFGTFTENIWDAVYGGVWAQVLHNPSFEPDYLSAQSVLDATRYGRLVTDPSFGSGYVRVEPLPEATERERTRFIQSSALGLPLPWEALRMTGARYEPRDGEAFNSYRSLLIMGLANREVGVRQGVYLPIHRTGSYVGKLWTKVVSLPNDKRDTRAPLLSISFRRRDQPDDVIARTQVMLDKPEASSQANPTQTSQRAGWIKHEFKLDVPPSKIASLEKVDFCLAVDDERRVFVDNVWLQPADHIEGFDPEIIRAAREMRTPLLRFGGNFVSGYHWQDGVGDMDKRRTMLNQAWGLPEYNHFGTDEFIRLCRLIGAEPQISVNAGSGESEEAAAWVEYCNGAATTKYGAMRARHGHPEPYNVKLWEIGNELWGDFQIGWQTAASNATRYVEFVRAMRKVDPSIKFIATGADIDFYRDWNAALIDAAGSNLDLVSTHLVIGMQPAEQRRRDADDAFTHASDFAVPVAVGRKLDEMRGQFDSHESTRGRVKLAFTEWQFWSPRPQDPRFTNMGGALNSAAFFNMLTRRADFVPISNMSNLVGFAGIHRQRGRTFVTPSYHVFRLYSDTVGWRVAQIKLQTGAYDVRDGNRRAPETSDVPYLDALALLSPDAKTMRVYLINRHQTDAITTNLQTQNFTPSAQATMRRLSGGIDEANTPEQSARIAVKQSEIEARGLEALTLPPRSVSVVELKTR
ncbi:MAG: hypothetical protein MSG64_14325 [Pyrinomonadaceae bacterium MAG19_C2-C3]|nr:hypothetical protein [Pyrinomonadaceae bacterium MAG19_C2-C3]